MSAVLHLVVERFASERVRRFRSDFVLSGTRLASYLAPLDQDLLAEHPVEQMTWRQLGPIGQRIATDLLQLPDVKRVSLTPHTLYVWGDQVAWHQLVPGIARIIEEAVEAEGVEVIITDGIATDISDLLAVLDDVMPSEEQLARRYERRANLFPSIPTLVRTRSAYLTEVRSNGSVRYATHQRQR